MPERPSDNDPATPSQRAPSILHAVVVLSAARWKRVSEWPLTGAAVTFLGAYAVPIVAPGSPASLLALCDTAVWVTWVVFALDFLVRVALAEDRGRYILRHWLDMLIIALPLLRPLRLLRLVTLLQVLNRRASDELRGKVAVYVAGGSALLAFCGALAVLDAERADPDANIVDFSDALWWAITTMTTVGYGDRYPTTGQGRLVATALMIGGITLLGTVTATLASWLVQHVTEAEQREVEDLRTEVRALSTKLDEILTRMPSPPTK